MDPFASSIECDKCRRELLNRHPANVARHKNSKESWPLGDGVPQQQAQLPKADVAGHILRHECGHANGVSACAAEACGFCRIVCHDRSSGVCNVGFKKGSTSHIIVVTSSCPQVYKMSYTFVEKGSTANPCTNRPVAWPICFSDPGKIRKYVWSYHFLHHMQSVHPAQKLSTDDIETFALSVAEFKGVIGKGHKSKRRDQKVQEAQDLLQAEATLEEVPALF
eukprot:gene15584-biopygen24614